MKTLALLLIESAQHEIHFLSNAQNMIKAANTERFCAKNKFRFSVIDNVDPVDKQVLQQINQWFQYKMQQYIMGIILAHDKIPSEIWKAVFIFIHMWKKVTLYLQ